MRRNLSHIIAAAFNEPLLLEPAYARVFFCALGREMGASSLSVPQQQVQFDAPGMLAETDEYMAGGKRPARVYRVVNGIAVLPVTGTLVHRLGGMRPFSGMTGYDGIVACLQQAMADSQVRGVLLDIDSPGGQAAGAFDCADMIYRLRYLDFFKGEIGKTHLAQELWTQIDNGQLAPDLAEIRTSITDVSNEITQTVNKKLEDQSAAIQQIQKVQVDTNNNLNSMWAVRLQQMQDGRLYIAGIGAGIENAPDGMQSQVLLAADRIAMINPANGNTKPMFVGQGDQIFMNEVFLKYLTAPTITSGGNPPAFSLTPDGRLTAKNADISGNVNANSGTLNNVTINENCRVLGKLSANQIEGDLVKTVGKAFPRDSRAPERWPSGTITVRIYDDQPFDRQIVIPAVAFSGAKHEREHTDIYSSCRLIVRKNGAEIYNRTALDNTLIYSGVIDMPAGHGHMTLEFSVSAWLVNNWYPTASISDLLVVVMKKATAGISIS
ncbi:DUF1983 domain-containing protein [Escherichia coli]